MTPELERLVQHVRLPTPCGVALRIIELAQDPEIDIARVARTISLDPALTTRVLRTANSPLYAQRRRCANLHQAMVVLGLNATLTLALSFTLAGTLRGQKPRSIDYPFYWSRALISALAARALGEALGQPRAEELFLAGLLQDVGMLALDQALPEMYLNTAGLQRDHHALAEFERKRLGTDHASIGGRLMNAWNLPERLHRAISISHVMEQSRAATTDALAHRCVALSGLIADLYLVEPERRDFQQVALATGRSLGLGRPAFGQLLRTIGTLIPDTASLFDTDLQPGTDPEAILEQARNVLELRNLQNLRDTSDTSAAGTGPELDAPILDENTAADAQPELMETPPLDHPMVREFERASQSGLPLSLAFVALRHLESDEGTRASEQALPVLARALKTHARHTDIVVRHDVDGFALLMPQTDPDTARHICERIVREVPARLHEVTRASSPGISIGCATHARHSSFTGAREFMLAAHQALHTARLMGPNRMVVFEPREPLRMTEAS